MVFIKCKLLLYSRDIGSFRLVGICLNSVIILFCVSMIGNLVCFWFEIKFNFNDNGYFNILW